MSAGTRETVRLPVVAGLFYPRERNELIESIRNCFTHRLGPGRVPAALQQEPPKNDAPKASESEPRVECLIVPHAAYQFSGPVAAHSFLVVSDFIQSLENVARFRTIIVGPNHNGVGSGVALSPAASWRTPLGDARLDEDIVKSLARKSNIVDLDAVAHMYEHSIEVQIPFLQAIMGTNKNELRFVPISLMLQDRLTAEQVGDEILESIRGSEDSYLILGSSDLTHYAPDEIAKSHDLKLMAAAESMDLIKYYATLERLDINSCGYGAIATVIHIAKKLGKKKGTMLKYATSGDVTRDESSVVGYPSVHFS
jgi:MEMO1 family protein